MVAKYSALAALVFAFSVNAESLCSISEVGELNVVEEDLNLESALRSIEIIKNQKNYPFFGSFDTNLVAHNRMLIIEGTLLKQNVLVLKQSYEKSNAEEDRLRYEKSFSDFCEYLKNAKYMD